MGRQELVMPSNKSYLYLWSVLDQAPDSITRLTKATKTWIKHYKRVPENGQDLAHTPNLALFKPNIVFLEELCHTILIWSTEDFSNVNFVKNKQKQATFLWQYLPYTLDNVAEEIWDGGHGCAHFF